MYIIFYRYRNGNTMEYYRKFDSIIDAINSACIIMLSHNIITEDVEVIDSTIGEVIFSIHNNTCIKYWARERIEYYAPFTEYLILKYTNKGSATNVNKSKKKMYCNSMLSRY